MQKIEDPAGARRISEVILSSPCPMAESTKLFLAGICSVCSYSPSANGHLTTAPGNRSLPIIPWSLKSSSCFKVNLTCPSLITLLFALSMDMKKRVVIFFFHTCKSFVCLNNVTMSLLSFHFFLRLFQLVWQHPSIWGDKGNAIHPCVKGSFAIYSSGLWPEPQPLCPSLPFPLCHESPSNV